MARPSAPSALSVTHLSYSPVCYLPIYYLSYSPVCYLPVLLTCMLLTHLLLTCPTHLYVTHLSYLPVCYLPICYSPVLHTCLLLTHLLLTCPTHLYVTYPSVTHLSLTHLYVTHLSYSPVFYLPICYSPICYLPICYSPVCYSPICYSPVHDSPAHYSPVCYSLVRDAPVYVASQKMTPLLPISPVKIPCCCKFRNERRTRFCLNPNHIVYISIKKCTCSFHHEVTPHPCAFQLAAGLLFTARFVSEPSGWVENRRNVSRRTRFRSYREITNSTVPVQCVR